VAHHFAGMIPPTRDLGEENCWNILLIITARKSLNGLIHICIVEFLSIMNKLEMLGKNYGIEKHVHIVVLIIILLPSVGKEWKLGRSQDMKTLFHIKRKGRPRNYGGIRSNATIVTRMGIIKPCVERLTQICTPRSYIPNWDRF